MDATSPHEGWTAGLAGSTQVAIVGALIIAIVVLALALKSGSSGGAGGYSPVVQASFIGSCDAGISDRIPRCTCAWNYIVSHVSYSDFVAGNQAVLNGSAAPSWLEAAITACQ